MRVLPERLDRADCIIFLDINPITCFYRIIKRRIRGIWVKRADLPNRCPEQLRWDFVHYVLTFNIQRRHLIMKLLEQQDKKLVVIIDSQKKADQFVQSIHKLF